MEFLFIALMEKKNMKTSPFVILLAFQYFPVPLSRKAVKEAPAIFPQKRGFIKGNRTIADLRYGEKDIISPSTLIFAPIKG